MLGLLALAISQTGFPNSCLSSATISHVAVAVRAINGTEGKSGFDHGELPVLEGGLFEMFHQKAC